MAGRPLRRLRNALRLNPLVGWEDLSGMSPRQAREPAMVLVKPGAEAKYAEVYNRVGLPLAVALHPYNPYPNFAGADGYKAKVSRFENRRRIVAEKRMANKQMAKRLNAIVLSTEVKGRGSEPFYASPQQQRGSTDRFSPYTPFVLLHRLGDVLTRGGTDSAREPGPFGTAAEMIAELRWARGRWYNNGKGREIDYLSRGVDTAAGRMGVIDADYLSDLWAKWLITGRVAYSPTNPPPESEEEANFRNMVAEYAPELFRLWYDYLDRNRPMVIDI
jgi:hypothetical protein